MAIVTWFSYDVSVFYVATWLHEMTAKPPLSHALFCLNAKRSNILCNNSCSIKSRVHHVLLLALPQIRMPRNVCKPQDPPLNKQLEHVPHTVCLYCKALIASGICILSTLAVFISMDEHQCVLIKIIDISSISALEVCKEVRNENCRKFDPFDSVLLYIILWLHSVWIAP